MTASEIRAELLAQHKKLREAIEHIKAGPQPEQPISPCGFQVRQRVAQLVRALAEHNLREEEVLTGLLLPVDAWGSVRNETMCEQHRAEHEAIAAALANVAFMADSAAAARLLDSALECVLEHMNREETTFLAEPSLGIMDRGLEQVVS